MNRRGTICTPRVTCFLTCYSRPDLIMLTLGKTSYPRHGTHGTRDTPVNTADCEHDLY